MVLPFETSTEKAQHAACSLHSSSSTRAWSQTDSRGVPSFSLHVGPMRPEDAFITNTQHPRSSESKRKQRRSRSLQSA